MEQTKRPFWKREPVLCIAAVCAAASMALNPPSAAYLNYIDWRVLTLLFCLMAVVAGLQECGVFAVLAQRLLAGERRMRFVTLALVLLPFFVSMLVTNDVALITFVPFAVLTLARLFHGFNCRSDRSILKIGLGSNKWSVGAFVLGLALLCLVLFVPGLQGLFTVSPLTGGEALSIFVLAFIPTLLLQIYKLIRVK